MIATSATFNEVFELDGPGPLDAISDVWDLHTDVVKQRRNARRRKSSIAARSPICLDHLPSEFLQPLDLLQLADDEFGSEFSPALEKDTTGGVGSLMWLAAAGALSVVVPAMTVGAFPVSRIGASDHVVIGGVAYEPALLPGHIMGPAGSIPQVQPETAEVLYAHVSPRIVELEGIAADEEIDVSSASKTDLVSLFVQFSFKQTPSIFLLDSGNFKVAWRESLERHVSFELLGNGAMKPVIFSKDDQSGASNHLAGVMPVRSLSDLLAASGLKSWILKD
ncbi:hypothetical protein [Devosia sp.]|uniref:hypothetical protein n=1 Tax=Devosia sp. TaxID=1871048 RepID=UPI0025DECDB3|nr:hypothetical protein [Devosia sp.]MCR6634914.1 hypothetical protein [Devosia sp.]